MALEQPRQDGCQHGKTSGKVRGSQRYQKGVGIEPKALHESSSFGENKMQAGGAELELDILTPLSHARSESFWPLGLQNGANPAMSLMTTIFGDSSNGLAAWT